MYIRKDHAETRIPALRDLIRSYPLGVLTTAIPSSSQPLIQATHVPWVLEVQDEDSETELGVLRGHLARQNPHSKTMIESVSSHTGDNVNVLEQDVLVLFTAAPAHYVTPKFYTETKPVTGKVVPTWNYAAVQAYGKARIFHDSKLEETSEFLGSQMTALTNHTERSIMGYTGKGDNPDQWRVTDAPERYIEVMKKAVIGIEITIERLEGKFKMSQEMSKGDREGVVKGFARLDSDVAKAVSEIVNERSEMKEGAKQNL
ncbi:transcriptional regulator [Pochonia chlamydosporia 170]|uniref:Transcriptional regulator n=1 Tax=Pochonia chlamydosporia 170 TaxID=1380566 RepID=A0A179FZ03_METCM|nr:transcriptional regulator [Pochonia chlamydosporia 170]OAQ70341.1 transcriptional regulator [Pochonia chlamydosporia 170]